MKHFETAIGDGARILTDGDIETRVMFETDIPCPSTSRWPPSSAIRREIPSCATPMAAT
jgi:hypothetical protein